MPRDSRRSGFDRRADGAWRNYNAHGEQAQERAADGPGNKGHEAARAAVEMATLFRQLRKGIGDHQD